MATWTELTFVDDTFLTSSKLTAMFNNLLALAQGTTGAPRMQTAAIAALAITNPKIGAEAFTEPKVAVPVRFPLGTKWFFAQAAAPPGWTQVTSQNDKLLRVVSGAGGGTGGAWGGGTTSSAGIHTHTISSAGSHYHGLNGADPWGMFPWYQYGGNTDYAPNHAHSCDTIGDHTHTSLDTAWRPAYVNIILCSKD